MVLVDDAGQSGPDLCQTLVRLSCVASAAGATWTLVLATTEKEAERWPQVLLELVDLKIELYPWDADTTVDYLQHALMSAGRVDPVFTEELRCTWSTPCRRAYPARLSAWPTSRWWRAPRRRWLSSIRALSKVPTARRRGRPERLGSFIACTGQRFFAPSARRLVQSSDRACCLLHAVRMPWKSKNFISSSPICIKS